MAGTNDLASRHVSSEDLIKKLDESINELTEFHNLHHIFLCQLPPRFDFHNINARVTCFNELLVERFADTEEFVTVLDAVPAEFKNYHHDGLHLSDVGLTKQCRISCPIYTKLLLLLVINNIRNLGRLVVQHIKPMLGNVLTLVDLTSNKAR